MKLKQSLLDSVITSGNEEVTFHSNVAKVFRFQKNMRGKAQELEISLFTHYSTLKCSLSTVL